jgi:hypothetical protein
MGKMRNKEKQVGEVRDYLVRLYCVPGTVLGTFTYPTFIVRREEN